MKKVISALTAVAMCASMSVSVLPAFAAYTASDIDFYLGVVGDSSGKGVVSADGSTITFASAADAAGAELTINSYFHVADTSDPSVASWGMALKSSSASVQLPSDKATDFKVAADGAPTVDYTLTNGTTFSTNLFVNCFGYLSATGKFKTATGTGTWASSDNWYWDYDGPQILSLMWQSDFDKASKRDNYDVTAAFLDTDSTKFPSSQFKAELASDIADGTYTIDFSEWTHDEYGKQDAAWVALQVGNQVAITQTKGITIVVGNAQQTTESTTTTEETTTTATESTTTESTTQTTETTSQGSTEKGNYDSWTWYVEDTTFDPEKDAYVTIPIKVAKDQGTFGFKANILVDGKSFEAAGFSVEESGNDDGPYASLTMVQNHETGEYAAAEGGKASNSTAEDGEQVIYFVVIPPEDAQPGQVYNITIENLLVTSLDADNNTLTFTPPAVTAVGGTLTIAGGEGTTTTTSATTTTTEETTTTSSEATTTTSETTQSTDGTTSTTKETTTTAQPTTNPAGYLYGDVNENGKVELVDIVMLNRFLTKYDGQTLTDVATVNANCYRSGETDATTTTANLDGQDSMEILKYLIGLVTTLPNG